MKDGAVLRIKAAMANNILPEKEDINAVVEYIEYIATQRPEKPDYWSSCGQCQTNINNADDLITPPWNPS